VKLSLAFFICLLSCGLAASEFPELVNLRDVPSNDYSLQFSSDLCQIESTFARPSAQIVRHSVARSTEHPKLVVPVQDPAVAPGIANDLLHLLSIQRT
jgi:hypothetical protein